jgi:predicted RNA-binding Zn ribbon-like protein
VVTITTLELVGGALALDFANTREGIPEPDHLREPADLLAWGARMSLIDDHVPSRGEVPLERALELRAAVDATFRAIADGRDPPGRALDTVRDFDAAAVAGGRLVATLDGYDWTWDRDDAVTVLHAVARSAVDLLRAGPLDRLKSCAVCPWLFLDASRNRSRRWCSMNECGGRDKMKRYRARRATAGRPRGSGSPPRSA